MRAPNPIYPLPGCSVLTLTPTLTLTLTLILTLTPTLTRNPNPNPNRNRTPNPNSNPNPVVCKAPMAPTRTRPGLQGNEHSYAVGATS